MFNSVALNVVIGLVFIFLLYSLLATTINEAIAATFNLRAKKLEKAIKRMLDDGIMSHHNFWTFTGDFILGIFKRLKNFFLLFSFKKQNKSKEAMSLVESFYDHPGIKYLGENKISNKPSYISPEFFSKALTDVLKEKANDPTASSLKQLQDGIEAIKNTNETKKLIQSLLADANNDVEKFKTLLEDWFNETMNRTSGWYKKQSQKITFLVGFVLAVAFNVDTVSIVKKLSNNPDSAKALADVTVQYVATHKDSTQHLSPADSATVQMLFDKAKKQVDEDIADANSIIGLGWTIPSDTTIKLCTKNALNTKADSVNCKECLITIKNCTWRGHALYIINNQAELNTLGKVRYVCCMAFSSGRRLIGYLLTALAISFGAPFWFDLLNKFVQLRGAGIKPEEPAEKTK